MEGLTPSKTGKECYETEEEVLAHRAQDLDRTSISICHPPGSGIESERDHYFGPCRVMSRHAIFEVLDDLAPHPRGGVGRPSSVAEEEARLQRSIQEWDMNEPVSSIQAEVD